ncbi:MAG: SDR family NAD(P)-dependent oxidoreductase, partial [Gammaproteobacteria bacterium]|nr:SDR family NAD(P)-dependent oxidoreductase [Gammaproteobacteria bacterium]
NGKRVWIVGASSGIGEALVHRLRRSGARLALTARNEAALRELASAGELVLPADVTDAGSLRARYDLLLREFGGLDLLVYCAGVYTPMRAWEIDLPLVRETIEINLLGVYNLLDLVVPSFSETGAGAICLVSSVAGYTGLPKALAYGPGKAALINLAQTLYTDLSPLGIGVYLINPGFVATRLTRKNDFRMPALISPDAAATAIIAGLGRGDFEIRFPRGFTGGMKRLGRLPDRLRFYLIGKLVET